MQEYTWDKNDNAAATTKISREVTPTRAALTATAIVLSRSPAMRVLLVDPHPSGTWNTWMSPYASLVLERESLKVDPSDSDKLECSFLDLDAGDTLADVAQAMDELLDRYQDEYRAALNSNMNNILSQVVDDWSGEPFYVAYSLKFSHTSKSYTAYRFSYYRRETNSEDISVDHIWMDPQDILAHEAAHAQIEGKEIAESVSIPLRKMLQLEEDSEIA